MVRSDRVNHGYLFWTLVDLACVSMDATREEIKSHLGKRRVNEARSAVYFLAAAHLDMNYAEISRAIGRDHTAVIEGIRSTERRMHADADLRRRVETIRRGIVRVVEAAAA